MILPLGYSLLVYSRYFLNVVIFFLSIDTIVPSLFNCSPNTEANATGNLNSLGIIPDYIRSIMYVFYIFT